jgi:hypothetical protein
VGQTFNEVAVKAHLEPGTPLLQQITNCQQPIEHEFYDARTLHTRQLRFGDCGQVVEDEADFYVR